MRRLIVVQTPKTWRSYPISARSEFNSWWSMADSNRADTLACQARAGGTFASSAAHFEIDVQSSVCLLRTRSVRVIECLFEYHPDQRVSRLVGHLSGPCGRTRRPLSTAQAEQWIRIATVSQSATTGPADARVGERAFADPW